MFGILYNLLMERQYKRCRVYCYNCEDTVTTDEIYPYVFKIQGIGKLHNRWICQQCIALKFKKSE